MARLLPDGSRVSDATIVETRPSKDGCLVAFRQGSSPWTYGIALDLRELRYEYLYGPRHPVSGWSQWIETFPVNFLVDVDTGLVVNARRTQGDGHVLLHHDAPRWPASPGVDHDVWDSGQSGHQQLRVVEVGGLRPSDFEEDVVLVLHGRGSSPGKEDETLAVVTRTGSDTVHVQVAAAPETPRRHELDSLHAAVHMAELNGAATVTCDPATYGAEILGFVAVRHGPHLEARTSFVREDFEAAADA